MNRESLDVCGPRVPAGKSLPVIIMEVWWLLTHCLKRTGKETVLALLDLSNYLYTYSLLLVINETFLWLDILCTVVQRRSKEAPTGSPGGHRVTPRRKRREPVGALLGERKPVFYWCRAVADW